MIPGLGFEWNMLDQIKLRECEIRLRNADALREALMGQITPFAERHVLNPWPWVRPYAVEIMTAAQACVDEYAALITDVAKVSIPSNQPEAEERRKAVVADTTTALELVQPILSNILVVIENEDHLGSAQS